MFTFYEQQVLAWLRHELLEQDPHLGQGEKRIVVDEVRLEQGRPEGDMVVILFREVRRPQCIFGFRMELHEPGRPVLNTLDGREIEDPDSWANVIFANFQERIEAADMGLPEDCDPAGITWV